jgi:negative regulator of sigma E activity
MTMKHAIEEQISAFVDQELDPGELPLFSAQVARNPELRRKLARYSLIGHCLRRDPQLNLAALTIADRVSEALAAEPVAEPTRQAWPGAAGWWRPALGVAAGLILGVGLLLQLPAPESPAGSQPLAVTTVNPAPPASPAAAAPAGITPAASVVRSERRPAAVRADTRMTSYLVHHGEYAGMLSSRAVASRIVDQEGGARWIQARPAVLSDD